MKTAMKILSILLAAVLLLSLTACGNTQNTDVSSSDTSNSSVEQPSSEESSSVEEPSSEAESSSEETSSKTPTGTAIGKDEVKSTIWTGKVASRVAKGAGTKEFPYYIYTADEFAYALTTGGKQGHYYQLMADIYLNDVSSKDWMLNKNNNAWFTDISFSAHLDGNGYCVYGVWINPAEIPRAGGLMPYFSGGSITNLGVRSSFIIATEFAGGIVGKASTGTLKEFKNCFVDESVYVWLSESDKSDVGAGGILGHALECGSSEAQITFENCYSKVQLRTDTAESYRLNGIIGIIYKSAYTMKNCYSVGYDPYYSNGENWTSLLLKNGYKSSDVFVNVYGTKNSASSLRKQYWTKVSESSIKGSGAKSAMSGLDFNNVWETVDGSTPKLRVFKGIDGKASSVTPISEISLAGFETPVVVGKPEKQ